MMLLFLIIYYIIYQMNHSSSFLSMLFLLNLYFSYFYSNLFCSSFICNSFSKFKEMVSLFPTLHYYSLLFTFFVVFFAVQLALIVHQHYFIFLYFFGSLIISNTCNFIGSVSSAEFYITNILITSCIIFIYWFIIYNKSINSIDCWVLFWLFSLDYSFKSCYYPSACTFTSFHNLCISF